MNNKILATVVVIAIIIAGFFIFKNVKKPAANPTSTTETQQQTNQPPETMTPNTPETPLSNIATVETNLGTFEVTLDAKAAPKTVANFIKLAQDGFYNNLIFHRIVKTAGFHLIQGGDPQGTGIGGPGYTIPAEIGLKHTKGAIAMARTGGKDMYGNIINPEKASSGSQFYIVEEDIPQLDGDYTVFGYVTSGMDVVLKIGQVPTDANDKPVTPVIINEITIK